MSPQAHARTVFCYGFSTIKYNKNAIIIKQLDAVAVDSVCCLLQGAHGATNFHARFLNRGVTLGLVNPRLVGYPWGYPSIQKPGIRELYFVAWVRIVATQP